MFYVDKQRPEKGADVKAFVLVESFIFRGDDCLFELLGDIGNLDRDSVLEDYLANEFFVVIINLGRDSWALVFGEVWKLCDNRLADAPQEKRAGNNDKKAKYYGYSDNKQQIIQTFSFVWVLKPLL